MTSRSTTPWVVGAAAVVVYLAGITPTLGQTLLDSHAFRQTQTAYTAVMFAENGIDLLRPPLPVLGPPGIVPLEFPAFQAAGAVLMDLGLNADLAMRTAGVLSFLGTAALIYALARHLAGTFAAVIALSAFLLNAHGWIYGRASLIEYVAAGAGVAFVWLAAKWFRGDGPSHWAIALGSGILATAVKITTGGFYLLPVLLLRSSDGQWGFRSVKMWSLVILSASSGFLWSVYAQTVRDETPAAAFLSLQNQPAWLFGTVGQRLDLAEWRVPLVALLMLTGSGLIVWAPLAIARARTVAQPAFTIALAALIVVVPVVLFNLYAVHDYYFSAIAPVIALAIGLGADQLRRMRPSKWQRRATVGLVGAWVATIVALIPQWSIVYGTPSEEPRTMRIASFIRDHSSPGEWVIQSGLGWNPSFLYYARRRGIAVPDHEGFQDASALSLGTILADPRFGTEIRCTTAGTCEVVP
jgi:hypothetical protein